MNAISALTFHFHAKVHPNRPYICPAEISEVLTIVQKKKCCPGAIYLILEIWPKLLMTKMYNDGFFKIKNRK